MYSYILTRYVAIMNGRINVTRHEKMDLMCTQNLTTFLNFNFLWKHGILTNFNHLCSHSYKILCNLQIANSLYNNEDIYEWVYFVYIRKPSFLMPAHKCYIAA